MNRSMDSNLDSTESPHRHRRHTRQIVRVTLLVIAVLLLLPLPKGTRLLVVIPALSPLIALASLLSTRTLHLATGIGLLVAVIVLIRRRSFCRWVCPTGTCADFATRLGLRLNRRCPRLPSFGQWIALLTLSGTVLGYPLLFWLDPLAMFSGLLGITHAKIIPAIAWSAIGIAAVLTLSVVWPGIWCARLCPLGAFQDLLSRLSRIASSAVARSRRIVPDQADDGLGRRAVLGVVMGVSLAAIMRRIRASATPPLRPPGAVDEARFTGLCVRCGNCLRACPTHIIRPDRGEQGIAGLLTPTLDFSRDYCHKDCTRCTQVCPSGALVPLTTEQKLRTPIGLPRVNMNICLLGDDRECSLCRNWCPYEAITLEFSPIEYTLTPKIDPEKCPGCGACQAVCPTSPEKAIVIHPL
ncbi:4Fe-4S dicluster domain-containing protein [Planctomycetota bacterium]